jgi:hypothetical protein
MSAQSSREAHMSSERERGKRRTDPDDPSVAAHMPFRGFERDERETSDAQSPEAKAEKDDDEPDVEGHAFKHNM